MAITHRRFPEGFQYPVPDFEPRLCQAISEAIDEKTGMEYLRRQRLAGRITDSVLYLYAAFDSGFIDGIDASVGNSEYSVWVYLDRSTKISEIT